METTGMTDEEAKREMAPQKPVGLTREQDDMWRFLCTMAVAVITNKAQPAPFIDSGNGPERYVMPPIKLRDDQEMALVYDLWPHLSWSFQFALTEGWDRHENPQELKRQMPAFVFERQHEIELRVSRWPVF
jgi:hypothetical protein